MLQVNDNYDIGGRSFCKFHFVSLKMIIENQEFHLILLIPSVNDLSSFPTAMHIMINLYPDYHLKPIFKESLHMDPHTVFVLSELLPNKQNCEHSLK